MPTISIFSCLYYLFLVLSFMDPGAYYLLFLSPIVSPVLGAKHSCSWCLAFPVPGALYPLSWWCLYIPCFWCFTVYSSLVLFLLSLFLYLPSFPSPQVLLAMALTFEPSSGWLVVWLAHKLVHQNQEHTHTHTRGFLSVLTGPCQSTFVSVWSISQLHCTGQN